MIIQVIGLPGSGKTTLSNAHKGKIVSQEIKDKIRKTLKEKVKIKPEP